MTKQMAGRFSKTIRTNSCGIYVALIVMFLGGCGQAAYSPSPAMNADIPRFASNSPFDSEYQSPVPEEGKRLWASSYLWKKAPELIVEKWLGEKPETEGKYVLVEFWATWCSYCKQAVPKLNRFNEKYGGRLAVIAITEENMQTVNSFDATKMDYFVAIDTQGRMQRKMSIIGFPHIIIIEPTGYVVWEGFPFLDGYELTDEVIEKILNSDRAK
ncbi:MAG: thioredoxin-like domain-containing protein [Planctomycetota bacterium]|jgi:thiol-disulfide isomerase/thioredoxin